MTRRLTVALADRPYDVVVGRGILGDLAELAGLDAPRRVLVLTQPPVAEHHLVPVEHSLREAGHDVQVVPVPDGEQAKSLEVLGDLYDRCAGIPLRRGDAVVALGGGVVGDLGGFLAATWNRGIDVVQVPTTLLAQVDAAVGGKTGINLAAGKNLVGAFHQPRAVVADLGTLVTLPERIRTEGLGEVVKYGFIRDPEVLALLEADPVAARAGDPDLMAELVHRAVAVKAAVVVADERESGERAHLNLGHTYGHAVEALTGYTDVLHGEGVALGMLVALDVGERTGVTPPGLRDRLRALLVDLGLPTRAPRLDRDTVWQVMARDKKATEEVRFVLLEDVGSPTVRPADRAAVDAAIDAVEADR